MLRGLQYWNDFQTFSDLDSGGMLCLEDEISQLQKENNRIESQLFRMSGDMVMKGADMVLMGGTDLPSSKADVLVGELKTGELLGGEGVVGGEEGEHKDGGLTTYLLPLI